MCAVHLNGDAGPVVELEWMGVDWAVAELGWVALVEVDMDMRGEPGAGAGAGAGRSRMMSGPRARLRHLTNER